VLSHKSLQRCDSINPSAKIYNFIHACLVGANNGETNLTGDTETDRNGEYKNVF
jgi:hypothetical protein